MFIFIAGVALVTLAAHEFIGSRSRLTAIEQLQGDLATPNMG
jgi:hypothetical protein